MGVLFGLISGLCYTLSKSLFVEQPVGGANDDDDDDAGTGSLLRAERDGEAATTPRGDPDDGPMIQLAELGRSHAR